MTKKANEKSAFKAGMYLLETLTAGMYNDPLSIYREYIQNAADSIDLALLSNPWSSKRIHIDLDPSEKTITIFDKGAGISINSAKKILSSVGMSSKKNLGLRGFRGIGRLGGLAFCEQAIFRTKAKDEDVESIQKWNCSSLRNLMSNSNGEAYSLRQLFNKCTKFYQENGKKTEGSYFEVKLHGVQSFRNHLMDIKKLHDFLSMVAPVPLNPGEMPFAKKINDYLSSHISNYNSYDIILNGEQVYKPYTNMVNLTSKGFDLIDDVEFFCIRINEKKVAHGWYGKRQNLVGAITKGQLSAGIRIRAGNIQIGDNHLLDGCFRESRFNSYMIGEIHVDCEDLIPNSRRDDFIDNEMKGLFYNEIERILGLPISKKIRHQSREKSIPHRGVTKTPSTLKIPVNESSEHDCLNLEKKIEKLEPTETIQSKKNDIILILKKECKDCPALEKILAAV